MADDVARALGAGAVEPVMIAGKACKIRPLTAVELCEVERECVKQYKRAYLEDYKANLDLLAVADPVAHYQEKYDEVMEWDSENLPPRYAYQPDKVALTQPLRNRVAAILDLQDPMTVSDKLFRKLVAGALDAKMLAASEYKILAGVTDVPRVKISYSQWWITGNMDGMITFIWVCFRTSGVTKEEVAGELMRAGGTAMVMALSREIETLSAPKASFG